MCHSTKLFGGELFEKAIEVGNGLFMGAELGLHNRTMIGHGHMRLVRPFIVRGVARLFRELAPPVDDGVVAHDGLGEHQNSFLPW